MLLAQASNETTPQNTRKPYESVGNIDAFHLQYKQEPETNIQQMSFHIPHFHKENSERKKRKEKQVRKQNKKKDSNMGRIMIKWRKPRMKQ